MRYAGEEIKGLHTATLDLMRGDKILHFIAQAIPNYDEFDALVKEPTPPLITKPGGSKLVDLEDKEYRTAVKDYSMMRTNWMVITSLRATTDLEWDRVKFDKPSTWKEWKAELEESDFTEQEITLILKCVTEANHMNEDMLRLARQAFLAEARREEQQNSQKEEQQST